MKLRQDCTFKSQEGICSAFITRIQFISSSHFFIWRDRSFLDLNFTIKTLVLLINYQNAIMWHTEPKDLVSHSSPGFESLCVWFLFLFYCFFVERLHYIVVGMLAFRVVNQILSSFLPLTRYIYA